MNVDEHAGINAVELDTQGQYFVGLGGLPNAEGTMEMDAAVMDGKTMTYGAVMAIRCKSTAAISGRAADSVQIQRVPFSASLDVVYLHTCVNCTVYYYGGT